MKRLFCLMMFSLQLAGAAWSTPVDVSSVGGERAQVEFDAHGNAMAIFTGIPGGTFTLQASTLPFGGNWTTPKTLTTNNVGFPIPAVSYLALDPQGNAVVIWQEITNGGLNIDILSSTYISGTWTPITIKINSGIALGQYLQVAVDASGNAVAVWMDSMNVIYWAALPFEQTSWTMPAMLAAGTLPQVAVAPDGNAIAVWVNGANEIDSMTLPLGAMAWTNLTTLSPIGVIASVPMIEIDPNGNGLAVWLTNTNLIQSSTFLSSTMSWTNLQSLTTSAIPAYESLELDSHGNAILVWDDSANQVHSSTLPFAGSWTAEELISPFGTTPQVAVDHHGNAAVIFLGSPDFPYTSTRIAGGSWTAPVLLSSTQLFPSVLSIAMDPYGNALALWGKANTGPTQSSFLLHPSARIRSDRAFLRPINRR